MKKIFLVVSMFAALMLATSCSKDDSENKVEPQPVNTEVVNNGSETVVEKTYPITVKAAKKSSVSKISLGENGYDENFETTDKLVLTWGEDNSVELELTDGAGTTSATFSGNIPESADGQTISAHIGTPITSTSTLGFTSLADAVHNCCYLVSSKTFTYTAGSDIEKITLDDQNAYLSINLPADETSLYVNGVSYTLTDGKVWIAVNSANKIQSARLSLSNQTVESGKIYTVTRGASTFNADAEFSVSSTKKVKFSPGNLIYQASTGRWEFAARQWDYIGNADGNTASSNRTSNVAYIDLFGWGTWLEDADPTKSATGYGNYTWDNTKSAAVGAEWTTLTSDEWMYLINNRENASSFYGEGMVNNVHGLILLPDGFTIPDGETFSAGKSNWVNNYSVEQWTKFEKNGAVFLPAAGYRYGNVWSSDIIDGYYWTSSRHTTSKAYRMYFNTNDVDNSKKSNIIDRGFAVRLVRVVE